MADKQLIGLIMGSQTAQTSNECVHLFASIRVKMFLSALAKEESRNDSVLLSPCLYSFVDSGMFYHQLQIYINGLKNATEFSGIINEKPHSELVPYLCHT